MATVHPTPHAEGEVIGKLASPRTPPGLAAGAVAEWTPLPEHLHATEMASVVSSFAVS